MNEEKKLLKVLSSGDQHLINIFFEEIYNKYKGLVYFIIAKYVKNNDDIIDLSQDVFLSFFNNADKVSTSIKYYLTTTSKNMALNFLKKTRKMSYIDIDTIDKIVEDNRSKNNDDDFLDKLSLLKLHLKKEEYDILYMHLFDNFTFKTISTKLNMKESTVKTLYYRTIKKSRLIIKEDSI